MVRERVTGASLRTKILGILVSLTLVLGLGVTFQVRSVMSSVLISELDKRATSVAGNLADRMHEPADAGDLESVVVLLADTVAHNPDALFAYMTGPTGQVLATAPPSEDLTTDVERVGSEVLQSGMAHRHSRVNGSIVHEFEAPIPGDALGAVHIGFSEERISGVIGGMTAQMLVLTFLVALAGVGAAGFLTWILTRPVLDLVETTKRVGEGDLSARSDYRASDEIGSLSKAFNEMVGEIERSKEAIDRNATTRTRLIEKLIGAQEEERRRLARGLHDTVGQSLTSLSVGIALMGKLGAPDAADKAEELQELAGEALSQVREMSRELRPSVLDDLGLKATLERCAEDLSARFPGLVVDVHVDLTDRLPGPTETTLYRIIQEALSNAARHGRPRSIDVLVVEKSATVRAIVEDDGRGFDVHDAHRQNSVGIHAMKERAELLGGRLEIESSRDGTTVVAELPQ